MPAAPAPGPLLVRPAVDLLGPGDWDRLFGRRAPLEVEVGFGRDDALLRRAAGRPDRDFLGIELKGDRAAAYLRRAERAGVGNLRVLACRAETAFGVFLPDGRAAAVRILFPDPWPKDRHAAHRLLQPYFVREVRRVLEPGGTLLVATDDAAYGRQVREVVEGVGGFEEGDAGPGGERSLDDGTTIFERKGLARGAAIARTLWRRLP